MLQALARNESYFELTLTLEDAVDELKTQRTQLPSDSRITMN